MKIIVDKIKSINPEYVMQAPFHQNIEVEISEYRMQQLFYKIWEIIDDKKLDEWLQAEGYKLFKNGYSV